MVACWQVVVGFLWVFWGMKKKETKITSIVIKRRYAARDCQSIFTMIMKKDIRFGNGRDGHGHFQWCGNSNFVLFFFVLFFWPFPDRSIPLYPISDCPDHGFVFLSPVLHNCAWILIIRPQKKGRKKIFHFFSLFHPKRSSSHIPMQPNHTPRWSWSPTTIAAPERNDLVFLTACFPSPSSNISSESSIFCCFSPLYGSINTVYTTILSFIPPLSNWGLMMWPFSRPSCTKINFFSWRFFPVHPFLPAPLDTSGL